MTHESRAETVLRRDNDRRDHPFDSGGDARREEGRGFDTTSKSPFVGSAILHETAQFVGKNNEQPVGENHAEENPTEQVVGGKIRATGPTDGPLGEEVGSGDDPRYRMQSVPFAPGAGPFGLGPPAIDSSGPTDGSSGVDGESGEEPLQHTSAPRDDSPAVGTSATLHETEQVVGKRRDENPTAQVVGSTPTTETVRRLVQLENRPPFFDSYTPSTETVLRRDENATEQVVGKNEYFFDSYTPSTETVLRRDKDRRDQHPDSYTPTTETVLRRDKDRPSRESTSRWAGKELPLAGKKELQNFFALLKNSTTIFLDDFSRQFGDDAKLAGRVRMLRRALKQVMDNDVPRNWGEGPVGVLREKPWTTRGTMGRTSTPWTV